MNQKQNDILEHRLIMEKKIGRRLKNIEVIHHIDTNRQNNKILNLWLCANMSEHIKIHSSFNKLLPELFKNKIIKFKKGIYLINKRRNSVVGGEIK